MINSSIARQANAQLDLARTGPGDVNRLSLHYFNTEEEIESASKLLIDAYQRVAAMAG